MIFRSARKPRLLLRSLEQDATVAYTRVRDHWAACSKCRSAAAASAPLWCELGLELMKRRDADHPHWNACGLCQEAQEAIESRRCRRGRELEHEYRLLTQQVPQEVQD